MKPAAELLERLKAIDKVEEYFKTSTKKQFFIIDVDETALLTDTCIDAKLCFSIINSSLDSIYFIPVDGDGIIGKTMSCCEAVIFNDRYFSFLELKLNATSDKRRAIYLNRIEAVKQIESTLQFFNEKLNGNYEGLEREAIIATPDFYPRADNSWRDIAVEFADENDGIPLIETTQKVY